MSLTDVYARYLPSLEEEMRAVVRLASGVPRSQSDSVPRPADAALDDYIAMLTYHLGWSDAQGQPAERGAGKRIRPLLCLLVCEAAGGDWQRALPVAAALELVHNFSLVHDDIQDGSELRRGQPTVWRTWGMPLAINAGDALIILAHLAAVRAAGRGVPPDTTLDVIRVLDETCLHLTQGQHLDLTFEQLDVVSMDSYLHMIEGKSAALLSAATDIGARVAGADEGRIDEFYAFGLSLGLAFQVKDDILGIWGEAQTGKSKRTDLRARKKTLPVLIGLGHSPELRRLYAGQGPLEDHAVRRAALLLDEVSAREQADEVARRYSEEALAHLERAQPQGQAADWLRALTDMLLHREH